MADLEIINAMIPADQIVSAPVAIGVKTIVGNPCPARGAAARLSPDGGVTFQPYVDTSNIAITIAPPVAGTFIQRQSDDVRWGERARGGLRPPSGGQRDDSARRETVAF